jgi:hypothetical protein
LKELAEFNEPLKYEERIVVFLDILGWSNLIRESIKDIENIKRLGQAVKRIQNYVQYVEAVKNF